MNFSSTTTNIDFNSRMICVVDGDCILEMNSSGQTQVIGHTNKWCDELIEISQEYKKLCIDNGIIEEEKTAEQIAQEQIILMQQMMSTMTEMQKEIEVLKNGTKSNDTTGCEPIGNRPEPSKSSSKPSPSKSSRSAN